MSVATFDAASNSGAKASQTSYSWTHTPVGTPTYVIVIEDSASSGAVPSGITYGGVSMTLLGSVIASGGVFETSIWGLGNPGTGAKTVAVTTTSSSFQAATALTFTGSQTSTAGAVGTVATGNSSNSGNANPAVTATGGGSNDIYVGGTHAFCTAISATGTNQTSRTQVLSISGTTSVDSSTIPATSAGAFTWNETAGSFDGWTAVAVVLKGVSAAVAAPLMMLLGVGS